MALKGRNWAFVMYPESMPEDWFDRLQMTGLPFAISPLHDKDMNPTGECKKPHYHVICYYENSTTQKSVKELVCDLVNATLPIKLESMSGMYRYHIHIDNPEKYQYDDRDRIFINGFDRNKVDALTYTEVSKLMMEIQQLIQKECILEYADLLDILLDNDLFNMWDVARNNTLFLNTYISSRRYKTKQQKASDETSHNIYYVNFYSVLASSILQLSLSNTS